MDGGEQVVETRKYATAAWQANSWIAERTDRENWSPPAREGSACGAATVLDPQIVKCIKAVGDVLVRYLPHEEAKAATHDLMESLSGVWEIAIEPRAELPSY